MTKETIVLNLIKEGKTLEEIITYTNLKVKEVYQIMRKLVIKGYIIDRKYFYDGEIQYGLKKELSDSHTIITSPEDNELEFMVISDLHLGSIYENPHLLNIIYDYCTKNNIHIILNTGDLVEGDVNKTNVRVEPQKQLDHALRVHPLAPDIINFLLLGNHDYNLLTDYGIDLMSLIKERREDIVPIGYGEGKVLIKSDCIIMQHPLVTKSMAPSVYNKTLIIRGHGHAARINHDSSNLTIYAPSLSNLNLYKSSFPGAIILKIRLKRGIIEMVYLEELTFINNKMYTTNEIDIHFARNKSFKVNNPIYNEEEYPKTLRKAR